MIEDSNIDDSKLKNYLEPQNDEEEEEPIEKMIINKKRENFQVQIRNSKKKQILQNNRVKMYQKYVKEIIHENGEQSQSIKSMIPEHILQSPQKLQIYLNQFIEDFKKEFENYNPQDYSALFKSLNHLRQFSFLQQSASVITQLIQSNLHNILIQLISPDFDSQLRYEAAWLLTNCLAASNCEDLDFITRNNYVNILEAFASLYQLWDNEKLFEIGIWGLTNLCVDIKEAAELFYQKYGFEKIEEKFITYQNNIDIQENLSWMMTVFSQYNKIFTKADKMTFLKLAEKQVMQNTNSSIQHYGIRIIYQLTIDDDCCQAIVKREKLIDFLLQLTHNSQYISYVIGIMGNIIACQYEVSQILMNHNILEYLSIALDNVRVDVRKESMWCIANLLTGSEEEIQQILDYNRLIEKVFRIARIDTIQVIYEVCMGLVNCLVKANNFQIMKLVQMGILEIFVSFFMIQDVNIVTKTLQGVGFLLDYGQNIKQSDQENPIKSNLQQLGFNQILSSLQCHPHDIVYDLSTEILNEHYSSDIKNQQLTNNNQMEECEI
ncbi:armadillo/beta-catenin repeat protein (macronuclear) [Tetrahymena thermophila SB210]|uniref:Armadillo/beta-catenin repeat protein n=1 Tax=Tetrahymena thermophila (strain SB210) TaxID=312017 RepID=I7M0Y4_TETTS|nr:armadillo/beta-catenin repeat protein [Tetrahymena thermophila SB210]EAR92939.2 armadillo/beta-catenin repeat protein [Tetrahymena thermophila SB210]|eukprot:XP_001013184.2 armadillo/beta-catenin repeat protein [Tetrahymena thermophila SB210]